MHARFILDIEKETICNKFLPLQQIVDDPDAENIYQGIMQVIGESGLNLPLEKLVRFACDGASVMISVCLASLGKI